ncbi:hypothetical protein QQG55_34050 [Brugia pahangi]
MGSSKRANSINSIKDINRKPGCPIPLSSGCLRGFPLPSSLEEGIKMKCSNEQCIYQDQLMHLECFRALEDNLVKIMSNIGSARGWTDAQRRSNLWEKKGLSLIQRKCRCICGLGLMRLDQTAIFLANRNATQLTTTTPKNRKGRKNLPKLNFSSTNAATVQNDKIRTKAGIKKRNISFRSTSPSNGFISVSSSLSKYNNDNEHRSTSIHKSKCDPEIRNTKSEYGTKPVATERKSFISKKFNGKISYAEITVMKQTNNDFVFNQNQFPKADDIDENGIRTLREPFTDLQQIQKFNTLQTRPQLNSVDISTNTSTISLPFEELQNSLHCSLSSDDTFESKSYYHTDTDFFINPADLSMILPSPPETPPYGPLSFTDDNHLLTQKNDIQQDVNNESIGYYSLFSGYSFCLGEILIAEKYLPGLL